MEYINKHLLKIQWSVEATISHGSSTNFFTSRTFIIAWTKTLHTISFSDFLVLLSQGFWNVQKLNCFGSYEWSKKDKLKGSQNLMRSILHFLIHSDAPSLHTFIQIFWLLSCVIVTLTFLSELSVLKLSSKYLPLWKNISRDVTEFVIFSVELRVSIVYNMEINFSLKGHSK